MSGSPSKVFRFPVYQIDFSAVASGKHIAASKRRIRWRYGFPNRQALEAGRTGTDCRGEEHDVVIIWSVTSGKRQVLMDGKEIHYASSRTSIIDHSWSTRGNHVMKIIAHAAPPLTATPGFRQYDLLIDGQSFFTMPKVYELGIRGVQERGTVRPGGYISDSPHGDYGGGGYEPAPRITAPHSQEEEEEELRRAINASLAESRRHLDRKKSERSVDSESFTSPPPPTTADLLDFGGDETPQAPAGYLGPPPPSDHQSMVPFQNGYPPQQSYAGDSYGSPPPHQQQPYPGAPPPQQQPYPGAPQLQQQSYPGAPPPGQQPPPAQQQQLLALPAYPGQGIAQPPSPYGAPPPSTSYGAPPPPPSYGASPQPSSYNGQPHSAQPYGGPSNQQQQSPYGVPQPPTYGAPPHPSAQGSYQSDGSIYGSNDPFAPKPPSHNDIASEILKGYGSPPPPSPANAMTSSLPGYQTPGSNYQSIPGDQPLSLDTHEDGFQQNGTSSSIRFTMNSLALDEEEEEEEQPMNEFEAAFKKLVNIDHIDEAPEEKIKLTMKKNEDEKAKKLKGKSQPKPPAALTLVGSAATLEQIKQVKPEMQPKEGIMKAPPQPWHPQAAAAGMLVIHGQAPPDLGPPMGFGAGYNPGMGYGGGGMPPPAGYGPGSLPPPAGYGPGNHHPPAGYGPGNQQPPAGYGPGNQQPPPGYGPGPSAGYGGGGMMQHQPPPPPQGYAGYGYR